VPGGGAITPFCGTERQSRNDADAHPAAVCYHDVMTFLAAAAATVVGGTRQAAQVRLRTSDDRRGVATASLPPGFAGAVVTWADRHLLGLVARPIEEVFSDLGRLTATWNDRAETAPCDELSAARIAAVLVVDALWDLWAATRALPLWKVIVDLSPEQLVAALDLRPIGDLLEPGQAVTLLETRLRGRSAREADLRREGYPVAPVVALHASDAPERIRALREQGWPLVRVEVSSLHDGGSVADAIADAARLAGPGCRVVGGPERPWWPGGALTADVVADRVHDGTLEALVEPLDARDVTALRALRTRFQQRPGRRIDVAAGARLHDLVGVKQLLAAQAVDVCRIDPARLGVSATLTAMLLAARLRTPVCLVAGQTTATARTLSTAVTLAAVDDIAIGASLDRRWVDLGPVDPLAGSADAVLGRPGRARVPGDVPGGDRPPPTAARSDGKALSRAGHR